MLRYNSSGKFNIPFGRYKTYNFDILKNNAYTDLLKQTDIYNMSFEDIFDMYGCNEQAFIFLDPPYDSVFTNYGYCVFGKDEHRKLADCFKKAKAKCLLIIAKTDFIVDLYKDYIYAEYNKKYAFKIHSDRVNEQATHLIIKNYS